MTAFLPAIPFDADTWRLGSAAISVITLFSLTLALRLYGSELTFAWRNVMRCMVALMGILTYLSVVRAKATPPSFPDTSPDLGLVLLVLIGLGLLVAVLGVFESHRRPPGSA